MHRFSSAACPNDKLRGEDDAFWRAVRGAYPAQEQICRLFPDLAGANGNGGQGRSMERTLGDIVEPDHGYVAARRKAAIGQTEHEAERAEIVVADDSCGIAQLSLKERLDRPRSLFAGRQARDDRPDRQAV